MFISNLQNKLASKCEHISTFFVLDIFVLGTHVVVPKLAKLMYIYED